MNRKSKYDLEGKSSRTRHGYIPSYLYQRLSLIIEFFARSKSISTYHLLCLKRDTDDIQRGVYFRFAAKIPKLTQTMSTVYPIMTTVLALTTLALALKEGYCHLQVTSESAARDYPQAVYVVRSHY